MAEVNYKEAIPTLKDEIANATVASVMSLDVDQYKYGFETIIESDRAPIGLSEDTIRFISKKKKEPDWMLEWRLDAYKRWLTMDEPKWARVHYPKLDFQDMYFYSAPKSSPAPKSLADVDPALLEMYEKLGVPMKEREILAGVERPKVAVDAVMDSVSVTTTFRDELAKVGIIFCSISEAIREHPDLVKQYLGSVVPVTDNYYATLNAAVFTDGSFCYIPKGVRCPMELSTYFRINEKKTGQFERTLLIADEGAYVSYLEGCTAPMREENQLHAAVVELVAMADAEIKYSTVQNWYPGDKDGKGGIYNFVTKRGDCRGDRSKISWTQVETGSAITWKYPSCILRGDNSSGEFYSIAISNGYQQVDSGTKMLHLGKNTTSRIISKGIAAGRSDNTYRGQVSAHAKAKGARNFTQCDSLLIGDKCGAHTVPYIESRNASAVFEHEATTSKISDDQMFYCQQRGLSSEEAVALIVNGFVRDVLQHLPMEFMVETQKLISISLEGERGMSKPVINIADLELKGWEQGTFYGASDTSFGKLLGLSALGVSYSEVPPGKSSCPFHNHHVEDEMFIVIEGEGTYRFGSDSYPIRAGSVLGAPAGGQETAHQIINTGTVPLRYYGISTMSIADVCEYPDSGKFGVFSRSTRNPYDKSTIRHLQYLDANGVDYWEKEPGA